MSRALLYVGSAICFAAAAVQAGDWWKYVSASAGSARNENLQVVIIIGIISLVAWAPLLGYAIARPLSLTLVQRAIAISSGAAVAFSTLLAVVLLRATYLFIPGEQPSYRCLSP